MAGTDDADARRQELYAKRDLLRQQQAERMEILRRETLRANFARWHGAYLTDNGIAHELLWDWDHPPAGPIVHYPFAFSGIDWRFVRGAVSTYGGFERWLRELLIEALDALGITPAHRVHLDWDSSSMPRLVLSAGNLMQHAETLMRWSSDLWVFDPDDTWIVEIYHEGTLSYARAPDALSHERD